MTEIESYALYTPTIRRAHNNTIYRDTPLPALNIGRSAVRPRRSPFATLSLPTEHVSDGILAGLTVLMVPAMVYSFVQLWSLLAGGSLNHAVRAFLP